MGYPPLLESMLGQSRHTDTHTEREGRLTSALCMCLLGLMNAKPFFNISSSTRDNPKYRANVNRLADLFGASRHPPLEDAAWLMEFVAAT